MVGCQPLLFLYLEMLCPASAVVKLRRLEGCCIAKCFQSEPEVSGSARRRVSGACALLRKNNKALSEACGNYMPVSPQPGTRPYRDQTSRGGGKVCYITEGTLSS